MTSPLTKPVEWLVFYSEKAGREYYYEPNSKIVTWIVPDDLHPNGTATGIETKAPVQQHHHQQQPTMARRVSFHQSVETNIATRETCLEVREERKQEGTRFHRNPIELWMILLTISILIGLGLTFNRESSSEASIHPDITIVMNHRIENDVAEGSLEDASSLPILACSEGDQQERSLNSIASPKIEIIDSDVSKEILMDPVPCNDRQDPVISRPIMEDQGTSKVITEDPVTSQDIMEVPDSSQDISISSEIPTLVESGRINEKMDGLFEPDTTKEQPGTKVEEHAFIPDNMLYDLGLARPPSNDGNKSCFVPFSHLFSKKCRQLAKERPLIDIPSFLDGMLQ